jgi:tRNA A37 threonylcarbamoyladenosine dehydratase
MQVNLDRRFGGVTRLYGDQGTQKLRNAHVVIVGIGGVGSWVVEALARTAVGRLTLIDLDMIAESNTNRQLPALGDEYGKAKVDAMAERCRAINPVCEVRTVEDFVTVNNVAELLTGGLTGVFGEKPSAVVDAIDQARVKVAMIAFCHAQGIPIVTVGAAGGQIDPTQIVADDLSSTIQDPLLSKVRASLRKEHGFTRAPKKKFGVTAIYSTEPLRYPSADASCAADSSAHQGLNCAGFGSSVCVTASFGFAAAAQVINQLAAC